MGCKICGSDSWKVLYRGKIRLGKFGECSQQHYTVHKCSHCKVGFLSESNFFYETDEYREQVDGGSSVSQFYEMHDQEQADKLAILGTQGLRDKVVADIGCGGGSFLDLLSGVARETVAIEPSRSLGEHLSKKHRYFQFCSEALTEYLGQVDIAVSFAVIEHVENPLEFLQEIRQLLKPEGFLLLSTPNYDDWLIEFLPGVYDQFFFRRAHSWYFNGGSLKNLAMRAGFNKVTIQYRQRYDISNALHWIRDHRPSGFGKTSLFRNLDEVFRQHLECAGKADFLYAWLWK
jgi:2-polyprenyl-3-methyl-5-hydroxy-6-metoxy-1,4-benzoquinol methylase